MKKNLFAQYEEFKAAYPNAIIFLYVGSFYEVLAIDAFIVHQLLGFKIGNRGIGNHQYVPMCGIPIKYATDHAKKLTEQGFRVVFTRQEVDFENSGLKKRVVSEVLEAVKDTKEPDTFKEAYEAFMADGFKVNDQKKVKTRQASTASTIEQELLRLKVENLTPMMAFNLICEWKGELSGEGLGESNVF